MFQFKPVTNFFVNLDSKCYVCLSVVKLLTLSFLSTELDASLINRYKIILLAMASARPINTHKFELYTLETAKLYVKLYPWHPMTPTTHKILIHGATVIRNSILPIGELSEEAQEARNKDFRKFRESFSRKMDRKSTNEDILNMLLISSDPVIGKYRKQPRTKKNMLHQDALELLAESDISSEDESDQFD